MHKFSGEKLKNSVSSIAGKKVFSEFIIPFLILGLLVCIFFYPAVFQGQSFIPADLLNASRLPWSYYFAGQDLFKGKTVNPELGDAVLIAFPIKYFVKTTLLAGALPSWNPYSFCGYSFQQRFMTQVFNPLEIPYYIFPLRIAVNIASFLNLTLAGYFTYLLMRSLRTSKTVAYFVAIVFMFNSNAVTWLEFTSHIKGELYIPLIIMFFYKGIRAKDFKFVSLSALFLGLQILSGIPQTPQYTMILLFFVAAGEFLNSFIAKKQRLELSVKQKVFPLYALILCIALALVVGAAFLWPFYQSLSQSIRSEQVREMEVGYNLSFLTTLIFPKLLYKYKQTAGIHGNITELLKYSGILTLFLAPFSLLNKRRTLVISVFAFIVFSFLVTMKTPFTTILLTLVPFLKFGTIERILALLPFSLALLSGLGLDYLMGKEINGKRPLFSKIIIFSIISSLVVFMAIYGLHFMGLISTSEMKSPRIFIYLGLILASAAITGLFIWTDRFKKWVLTLSMILIFTDLAWSGMDFSMATPLNRTFFVTPGLEKIMNDEEKFRILTIGQVMPADTFWIYGLESVEGYDPILPAQYRDFISVPKEIGSASTNGKANVKFLNERFLNLTNVKYILSDSKIMTNGNIFKMFDATKVKEGEPADYKKDVWNFQEHNVTVITVPPKSYFGIWVTIPEDETILEFYRTLDPNTWDSKEGDGVYFKVFVRSEGEAKIIFEEKLDPINNDKDRHWFYESLDLSEYAGKEVELLFQTDPIGNDLNDSPAWGNPRLASVDEVSSIQEIYDGEMKIFKNFDAFPRARLFYNSIPIEDGTAAINTLFDESFDYRNVVILKGGDQISTNDQSSLGTEVTMEHYQPDMVKILTDAQYESYLVLFDSYDKDWNVYVDGVKSAILRADFNFRAVKLSAGKHEVIFKYHPREFYKSIPFTIAGIVSTLLIYFLLKRKNLSKNIENNI
ncbi:MAG: YfhO family protein [Actinobacteria bacterium]|nr:YfhO family protein [Actinomycetota bacterium]